MKVKFLKYCPWTFHLTRQLPSPQKFQKGNIVDVADIEGASMVKTGYAKEISEEEADTKSDDIELVEAKGSDGKNVSVERLVDLYNRLAYVKLRKICQDEKLPQGNNPTKDKLIEVIIAHKKIHDISYLESLDE